MKKILYVEDDTGSRELLKNTLEHNGYFVIAYADGWDAIDAATNGFVYDLALVDLLPPGGNEMDGMLTIHELKRINPKIPVISISGYSLKDFQPGPGHNLNYGWERHLVKPVDNDDLVKCIEIELRSAADQRRTF